MPATQVIGGHVSYPIDSATVSRQQGLWLYCLADFFGLCWGRCIFILSGKNLAFCWSLDFIVHSSVWTSLFQSTLALPNPDIGNNFNGRLKRSNQIKAYQYFCKIYHYFGSNRSFIARLHFLSKSLKYSADSILMHFYKVQLYSLFSIFSEIMFDSVLLI